MLSFQGWWCLKRLFIFYGHALGGRQPREPHRHLERRNPSLREDCALAETRFTCKNAEQDKTKAGIERGSSLQCDG